MDLIKSFRIFQQVVELKSFSRAADSMNLVPSAVSRQVNELESYLGVRLLNRTTRSLHLTDVGQVYLSKMKDIMAQVDQLSQQEDENTQLSGLVKITAPIMLGQYDIPQILSSFSQHHPDVRLDLTLLNRKVDMIEEGYDLAIRVGYLADSNFYARKIGQVRLKTVVSSSYLTKSQTLNTPKDLIAHNCLTNTALAQPKRWLYRYENTNKRFKVDGHIQTNDSLAILAFIKQGLGVGQLPEFYVNQCLNSGELIEVLDEYAPEPLPVHLIYPSNRLTSATLRTLTDYIIQQFQEEFPSS